jgi:hypothetical protein
MMLTTTPSTTSTNSTRKDDTMTDKTTITVDGIEYTRRPAVSEFKIVRANRGYRDYIYVGDVTVLDSGDVRVDAPAACIRKYRERGLTGAASDPSLCTLDHLATSVTIRADAVVDILTCTTAWGSAL